MRDQQVRAALYRLLDDRFDRIDREVHSTYLGAGVAAHQAHRIPRLRPLRVVAAVECRDELGNTGHVVKPSGVWLARHGQTEWSRDGKHTGNTDVPLTDTGREQALGLGALLAGDAFELVLTSPLSRARDTAALAGFPDAEPLPDLREWDYGEYEGLTTPEIRRQRPEWNVFDDGCPGGELATDVGRRADRVLARARSVAGPVLCFAHGHILRVMAARWLGLSAVDGRMLALDTATVSALGWEHDRAVIRRWNSG